MRIAAGGPVAGLGAAPAARLAASAVPFIAAGVIAVAVATRVTAPSIGLTIGVAAGVAAGVWMFVSQRMERPLIVFLLYLGIFDGYLKLKTMSSAVTLGRDALLYAILLGFLARAALRRQPLRLPPLSGWVLAFTVVTLVQIANPVGAGSMTHAFGALRPHLEFVPLFFVGYYMLQTPARLRTFFLIMLVIATANGIVGVIQLNLTPAELSSWGPGYAARISGKGTGLAKVSGRTFTNAQPGQHATGPPRTRPFGLGDDAGVGEAWGMLALCGAIALVSLGIWRSYGLISVLLGLGPPLAIISGEGRGLLVVSFVALFTYILAATTKRRLIPTLTAVVLGTAAIAGAFAVIGSVSGTSVFSRYATVTPGKLAGTTSGARGKSFAAIGMLITTHPLGNGIGGVGPAAGFAGGGNPGSNGETEPGFLVSELGIPGLLVFYGFNVNLLVLAVRRVRRVEPEARTLVAALLAGVVGLLALGISSATTATSPESPFFWLAAGALSYWLTTAAMSACAGADRSADGSAVPVAQTA